jgi:hypothetical protein
MSLLPLSAPHESHDFDLITRRESALREFTSGYDRLIPFHRHQVGFDFQSDQQFGHGQAFGDFFRLSLKNDLQRVTSPMILCQRPIQ